MTRTHFIVFMSAVCIAVGVVANGPVHAQRSVGRRPAARPMPPHQRHYSSPVLESHELTPDPNSELIIPMHLTTLTNGHVVAEASVQVTHTPGVSSLGSDHVFVIVDRNASTYASFKVDGPPAQNPRIKAHLKSRYGIDWDQQLPGSILPALAGLGSNRPVATRQNARLLGQRQSMRGASPALHGAPLRGRGPAHPTKPRLTNASFVQDSPIECDDFAYMGLTSRDLLGYGVALAESYAWASLSTVYSSDYSEIYSASGDAGDAQHAEAPSFLLTNWYYDVDDSSDTENDESESGSGISMEDDSWFYNDDFPALWDLLFCPPLCLPLGRTLIENYSYVVAAPGGGDTYEVGIGWSGYYYLLGLEVDSETPDENCYSY